MAELALITPESSEIQPWERQDGEPLFWYNRYKRFQGLGPKRTILAALQQERRAAKAPKSTQNQEKLKPKSKSLSVPGSWKQASIRWQWVARAQAFDEDKVTQWVAIYFEDLYNGPALAFNRVMTLNNILDTITKDYNANNGRMSPDQRVAYFARMTTILRDIREEMRTFDHATQALILRHLAYKEYEEHKAMLTPDGYAQSVEKAGGIEKFSKELEQEKARRQELARLREAFAEEHQP